MKNLHIGEAGTAAEQKTLFVLLDKER